MWTGPKLCYTIFNVHIDTHVVFVCYGFPRTSTTCVHSTRLQWREKGFFIIFYILFIHNMCTIIKFIEKKLYYLYFLVLYVFVF